MATIFDGSNIGFMLLPVAVFAFLIVYLGSPLNQNTNIAGYFSSFSASNSVYGEANELVFESSRPSPSQPHQFPTRVSSFGDLYYPINLLTNILRSDICSAVHWSYVFLIFCGQIKRGGEKIEDGLARARAAILSAARLKNYTSYKEGTYIPRGVIYRNPYAFHQLSFAIYPPTLPALSITFLIYLLSDCNCDHNPPRLIISTRLAWINAVWIAQKPVTLYMDPDLPFFFSYFNILWTPSI